MNRRSFMRGLAAVFAAPSVVIAAVVKPAVKPVTMITTYLMGKDNIITGPYTRPKPIIKAVIGESVSWHLGVDKDGYAVRVYDEDEETVKRFYENWNKP